MREAWLRENEEALLRGASAAIAAVTEVWIRMTFPWRALLELKRTTSRTWMR